ncbi:hypothetical protein HY633_01955 [Candidatus Uhrbacteria bacterium]|nr:hypothetical protein [Candidatus Uhrbacteria bacterium]
MKNVYISSILFVLFTACGLEDGPQPTPPVTSGSSSGGSMDACGDANATQEGRCLAGNMLQFCSIEGTVEYVSCAAQGGVCQVVNAQTGHAECVRTNSVDAGQPDAAGASSSSSSSSSGGGSSSSSGNTPDAGNTVPDAGNATPDAGGSGSSSSSGSSGSPDAGQGASSSSSAANSSSNPASSSNGGGGSSSAANSSSAASSSSNGSSSSTGSSSSSGGPTDNCGGITWEGTCVAGNILEYCADGQLISVDCDDYAAICQVSDPETGFHDCVQPPQPEQPIAAPFRVTPTQNANVVTLGFARDYVSGSQVGYLHGDLPGMGWLPGTAVRIFDGDDPATSPVEGVPDGYLDYALNLPMLDVEQVYGVYYADIGDQGAHWGDEAQLCKMRVEDRVWLWCIWMDHACTPGQVQCGCEPRFHKNAANQLVPDGNMGGFPSCLQ